MQDIICDKLTLMGNIKRWPDNVTQLTHSTYRQQESTYIVNYTRKPYLMTTTFFNAKRAFNRSKDDETKLNRWCETWLNSEQWIKLKDSLRAARKRLNDFIDDNGPPVTITISREAWLMLSSLSKRNHLTLSEFIIKRHEKAWLKLGNNDWFNLNRE